MAKGFGTVLAPIPAAKKSTARAAVIDLKEPARTILVDCFRQFGVEAVLMADYAAERLHREKFEACIIKLGPGAETVMESIRTSPSNSRMVIYGLGGSAQEAIRYSKYGIKARARHPYVGAA